MPRNIAHDSHINGNCRYLSSSGASYCRLVSEMTAHRLSGISFTWVLTGPTLAYSIWTILKSSTVSHSRFQVGYVTENWKNKLFVKLTIRTKYKGDNLYRYSMYRSVFARMLFFTATYKNNIWCVFCKTGRREICVFEICKKVIYTSEIAKKSCSFGKIKELRWPLTTFDRL